MPRPKKQRQVCSLPRKNRFGPLGAGSAAPQVPLLVEEYETVRLIDLEGMTQEECAEMMQVARTTIQSIYVQARKKIADAIVNGKTLVIEGGNYALCSSNGAGCGRQACGCNRHGAPHNKHGGIV